MRRAILGGALLLALAGGCTGLVGGVAGMAGTIDIAASGDSASGGTVCTTPGPATGGGVTALDDADQRANAAAIIETGVRLEVPTRGLVVAIATAMQESTLRNLSWGDRDSVGLFQQRRPWGSFRERTTPAVSAELFFTGGRGGQRGLLDIPGWQAMPVTRAAQAVQVSAFPMAYAKWETLARTVVGQVTGGIRPEPVCTTRPTAAPSPDRPDAGQLRKYGNGRIPLSALQQIPWDKGERLRSDAADALVRLNGAYRSRFGEPICITDSYRDYAGQVRLYAIKPHLAARPGTSNHGWGVALDLCGGINRFGTPQHQWMASRGPDYGWNHPGWARQNGSRPEAWHFEYEG